MKSSASVPQSLAVVAVVLLAGGCTRRPVAPGTAPPDGPIPAAPPGSAPDGAVGLRPARIADPRPPVATSASASMEQPSPTHAASRLREYRLTEDVQLRVEAHKASLHTAHETLRNPRLIRVPTESSSCIADGLLGVEPGAGSWSLRQTHCAGARIYSEELVFTLPASGQPATLVRFEVTCIDRYAANQDGVTASLSHAKLGGLTFEDVDLATLYDQLDLSACDRDP